MAQEPRAYLALGGPIATQFTGIALPPKETALHQAVAGALDALITDGTYKALLDKWQLSDNGIEKVALNAGQ